MDIGLSVVAGFLIILFFSCLCIPFLLIRDAAWPATRQGRTGANVTSAVTALFAVLIFMVGITLQPAYLWCVAAIGLGFLYSVAMIFCVPASMQWTFLKAISFCLEALVVIFAIICVFAMTVGGQEHAARLTEALIFQQLWTIAAIIGAGIPVLTNIKNKRA